MCVGELMKSEDWMWAGAALEARSAITSDSQYISQAVAIYQKQGQWKLLIEATLRLLKLKFEQNNKRDTIQIINTLLEAAKNSNQEVNVLLTAAKWCLKLGYQRKHLLLLVLAR